MDKVYEIVYYTFHTRNNRSGIAFSYKDSLYVAFNTYESALNYIKIHDFTKSDIECDFRYELVSDKYDEEIHEDKSGPQRIIEFKEYPKDSSDNDKYEIVREYYSIREVELHNE